jgi:uncharacterized protein YidB (DUF937 family)
MSQNSSRWIALLGLLAVAGYQNRDKIGQVLGQMTGGGQSPGLPPSGPAPSLPGNTAAPSQQAGGGLLGGLRDMLGGAAASAGAGTLTGGLNDILERFNTAGHGDVAQSWVQDGPQREPSTGALESVLGEDAIGALTKQTGLSRDELLARLKSILPHAVDHLTPDGRVPSEAEVATLLGRT